MTSAAYDEVIIEKTNKYIEETKKDQDHKRTPSVVDQPSLPTAPPLPPPPLTSSIPAKTEVTDTTYDEVITEKKNSYIGGTKQDHKKTPSIGGQPSLPTAPPLPPPPLTSSIPAKTEVTDTTYDEVITEKKNSYIGGTKQDHKKTPSIGGQPSLPTAPPLPPPPLASSIPAKIQVINATYDEVIIEKTNKYIEGTKKDQDHKRTSSVVDQPSLPTAPPLPPPPLTSSIPVKTEVTDATYDEVITEKKNSYIGGTKQDHKKIPSVVGQRSVPTAPPSLASSIPMKTGAVKATSTKEGPTMYAIIDKSKKRKNRSSTHIVSPPSTLGGYEDTVLNEAKIQEKKRRRNSAYEDVVRLSTEDAGDNTYDKLDHNVIGTTLTPQILPIVPNYTDDVPGALPQYEIVKL